MRRLNHFFPGSIFCPGRIPGLSLENGLVIGVYPASGSLHVPLGKSGEKGVLENWGFETENGANFRLVLLCSPCGHRFYPMFSLTRSLLWGRAVRSQYSQAEAFAVQLLVLEPFVLGLQPLSQSLP